MTNYAAEIKSLVSMPDICKKYGLEINRSGFCCCPFHHDRKPSMKIYAGQRGYFCYVCNAGGDVIDFTRKYFSLRFYDACKKLNDDFSLGLPMNSNPEEERRRFDSYTLAFRQKQKAEAREKALQMAQAEYEIALTRFAYLDLKRLRNAPTGQESPISDEYAEAVKQLPVAKYELYTAEMRLVQIERQKN